MKPQVLTKSEKDSVRWFQSLRFRLFVILSIFVFIIVAAVSWQNAETFRDVLDKQIKEELVTSTQKSGNAIEGLFEVWRSLLYALMHSADKSNVRTFDSQMRGILDSNKEIVAIHVISIDKSGNMETLAFGFTPYVDSPHFKSEKPKDISAKILAFNMDKNGFTSETNQTKNAAIVKSMHKISNLPMLALYIPFSAQASSTKYAAVLSVWQDRVQASLTSTRDVQGFLLSSEPSVVVSSSTVPQDQVSSIVSRSYIKEFIQNQAPFGHKLITDEDGNSTMAAFSTIRNLGLTVITEREATSAYRYLNWRIRRIALLAWLFVLLGMSAVYIAMGKAVKHILETVGTTIRIAGGDFSARVVNTSTDEIGILARAINHMASEIEKLISYREVAVRQEQELKTAQAVQQNLLPKTRTEAHVISALGYYRSATECAGDWWGFFPLDDKRAITVIADATGHGANAALLVAIAYGFFENYMSSVRDKRHEEESLDKILTRFNEVLWHAGQGASTMTLFITLVDADKREISYCGAGHVFPYLVEAPTSTLEAAGTETAEHKPKSRGLVASGSILGFSPKPNFKMKTEPLAPFERVLLYTDGLFECENRDKSSINKRHWKEMLAVQSPMNLEKSFEHVTNYVTNHFGDLALSDDVTFVLIEFDPSKAPMRQSPIETGNKSKVGVK